MRTRDFVLILAHTAIVVASLACFTLLHNLEFVPEDRPIVRIRLANHTAHDFQQVLVAHRPFGALSHGAESGYRTFAGAYSYASIEAQADDQMLRLLPMDFVGESYLSPGSYTYVLTEIPASRGTLDITLRQD